MNIYQSYQRAVQLSKTTSRMNNHDWYKKSLELDVQVHFYPSEANSLNSYLFIKSKNHYEKLASIEYDQLENQDALQGYVNELLQNQGMKKIKSVGVILYVADELAIASLGPEHQNPFELLDLKERIINEPGEVLEDKTVSMDTHSWRLFPYVGAVDGSEFATAVVLSRKYAETMRLFREIGNEQNLPIVTSVLSAPICAVASLPWFSKAKEHGMIVVFNYAQFTLLAFFNQLGDLMMLRNMPHPAGSHFPVNIGSGLIATANAFELESPEINILSLVNNEMSGLITSVQKTMQNSDIMLIDQKEILKSRGLAPDIPLEMLVTTQDYDLESCPLASNKTFMDLKENSWHLQEFLLPSTEEAILYPNLGEMKLLKLGKYLKMAALVVGLCLISWKGFTLLKIMQSEAWQYNGGSGVASAGVLQAQIKKYGQLNGVLQDRSKGWVCLELLRTFTPEDGSVILDEVSHVAIQERAGKTAKSGMSKSWSINGFTTEKGLSYLESLTTRGRMDALFSVIAKTSGNSAYSADVAQRELLVDLQNSINSSFKSTASVGDPNSYPLSFKMNIRQTLSASDQMAISLK
ncbi:MAG: hypothetical protein ACSHX0_04835 [Akkermansiaceae bacterium]